MNDHGSIHGDCIYASHEDGRAGRGGGVYDRGTITLRDASAIRVNGPCDGGSRYEGVARTRAGPPPSSASPVVQVGTSRPARPTTASSLNRAPEPRVQTSHGGVASVMAPRERLHDSDANLEHDVLYVVSCSAGGGDPSASEGGLDGLIHTFRFLPRQG